MTKNLNLALAVAILYSGAAFAQSTSTVGTNQDLFPVTFSATCLSLNSASGRIVTTHITDHDIIAQALGPTTSARGAALVFNTTQDSLQVFSPNVQGGQLIDVIHFSGGAAVADNRQLDRLTFLFLPTQVNEFGVETNSIGTALITEQATAPGTTPNIAGKLEFVLTGGNVLGETNSVNFTNAVSTTNRTAIAVGTPVFGTPVFGTPINSVVGNPTNSVVGNPTNSVVGNPTNPIFGTPTNTLGRIGIGTTTNASSNLSFVMTSPNIVVDPTATVCSGAFATIPGSAPIR